MENQVDEPSLEIRRLISQRNSAFAAALVLAGILVCAAWALEVIPQRRLAAARRELDAFQRQLAVNQRSLEQNQAALKNTEEALRDAQEALKQARQRRP